MQRSWSRPVRQIAGVATLSLALLAGAGTQGFAAGDTYRAVVKAAERGDWDTARSLARKAPDPVAQALADWLYLTDEGTTPPFERLAAFMSSHPGWPGTGTMLTKAERALPLTMRAADVVAWFGNREPRTGDGAVRLGEAMIALGDRAGGEAVIRRAWMELDFTTDAERRALEAHQSLLKGAATSARVERLLWNHQTTDANRVLAHADEPVRTVARARMTLIANPKSAGTVIGGLPSRLRTDSGLLFEQARAERRAGDIKAALPLALKAEVGTAASKWWPERHVLAREAIDLGLYEEAYRLAASHGLSRGADFADAEWLAGWVALRLLNKPEVALAHFKSLYDAVSYPVSRSRGAYWAGRAAEAADRLADAATHYDLAAAHATTFYGQLAAARLDQKGATIALPGEPAIPKDKKARFGREELVRAVRIADAAGADRLIRPFFTAIAEAAGSPEDYLLAGQLALDLDRPDYAVRIGKKALQQDIVLPELSYPMMSVPKAGSRRPEPALVLGLSRQESEFNPRARSSAGARGLMQLLPGTAKTVARQENIKYDAAKLDDPAYNMRLGMAYLGELIDKFGGSYALAIAGYNAGPSRARQWRERNGDPSDPKVDAIDWIEKIPFGETRNYVQRVLENTQVYRGRLAQSAVALGIDGDLARPNKADVAKTDLLAYLGRSKSVSVANVPARPEKPAAAPPPAPIQVEAKPASPPPGEEEVAEAAPLASAPIPAPTPKPPAIQSTAKSKPPSDAKGPTAKPPSKPEAKKAAPPQGSVAQQESPTTAIPATAEQAAPEGNPFQSGQPETMAMGSCTRMMVDANGKTRCSS